MWKVELVVGFGGGFSWELSGFIWLLAVQWQAGVVVSFVFWWLLVCVCFEAGGGNVLWLVVLGMRLVVWAVVWCLFLSSLVLFASLVLGGESAAVYVIL